MEKLESTIQEQKQEKPQHKIELKERPHPLEDESSDAWLKRIGGPNIEISKSLEKCSNCKGFKLSKKHSCEPTEAQQKKTPLVIDKNGNFILNDKNLEIYFDKKEIDELQENKNPNIKFIKKKGEYQIKKELFEDPEHYRQVIIEELKADGKMIADKRFDKSIVKWEEEAGKESKEKSQPEAEKPQTLDEQIAQKKKELEEAQEGYNIYYSPVVKDLLGLYYQDRLKTLKKEMKGLKKGKRREPTEDSKDAQLTQIKSEGISEKSKIEQPEEDIDTEIQEIERKLKNPQWVRGESAITNREILEKRKKELETQKGEKVESEVKPKLELKDYLKHIKDTDNLFTEMAKVRGAVKRGEMSADEYEAIKKQWREAYQKTLKMNDMLSKKDLEKLVKMNKKKKDRAWNWAKKKWKEFWNLATKRVGGKKVIEETTQDAIKEQLEVIKEKIKQSGVIGRSQLEKEEKRLEKKLKKI